MISKKLEEALGNVETSYHDLVQIANDITQPITEKSDLLVRAINGQVNSLSIDKIREYILQLQLYAFEISEIKEKSTMKAELAETLQKEKFAVTFTGLDGTAAVKDKLATVEASSEVVAAVLYELVSNLLKARLDQLHRLVSVLQTILMSRGQEMKFMNIGTTNEIEPTRHGKQILHEEIL